MREVHSLAPPALPLGLRHPHWWHLPLWVKWSLMLGETLLDRIIHCNPRDFCGRLKVRQGSWCEIRDTEGSVQAFVIVQPLTCVRLFVTPRTAARLASLSPAISRGLFKLMSFESVMQSNHLILCHPLLLLSIFLSIRVFSNELALCIRRPKY